MAENWHTARLPAPPALTIVPTATLAEHLRHQQARAGLPVRPRSIQTIAQLLDAWAPGPAPAPLVAHLVERAIQDLRLTRFDQVAEFRGFHGAVAQMLDEAPATGLSGDWGRVLAEVDGALESRALARRNVRLQIAAAAVEAGPSLPYPRLEFEGFFSFGQAELAFVIALGKKAAVSVRFPEWPAAESARQQLRAAGVPVEQRDETHQPQARRTLFATPSIERETEEIARRILEAHTRGRKFREMAIVLRTRQPYAPILETTLARFGIPARFYFSDPLAAHPAIAFLSGVMRAMLAGWDHQLLLAAIRMPVSGIGATKEGDQLDFDWRQRLPAKGLPTGEGLLNDAPLFANLAAWDAIRRERLTAEEWASRLKPLRQLVPKPSAETLVSPALEAFANALDAAAVALTGVDRLPLATFWRQVEAVLALEPLRVPDRRRDILHVMDVFEARQWKLPMIFICGLTERHFPQYHHQDALLGDSERRRLGLDTAADRQAQERQLFDFALTRASEEVVLSYPRYDEKGEETLPSFFLLDAEKPELCETRVRPRPGHITAVPAPAPIRDPALANALGQAHQTLSPTSIEGFLQCPFQFFAAKTLRLARRPALPRDRLDALLQGSILHRVLAEWTRTPLLGSAIFDRVFEDECARHRVPATYRTEAVRLELLRNFESFLENGALSLRGWTARVEESFRFDLDPSLAIRGRIDRLELGPNSQAPNRQALVIDYKYSAGNKIRERVEESGAGQQVQAGLYLAAAERAFGFVPAGMLFCGLKKDVTWDGWHTGIAGLEAIGTSCTGNALRDLIRDAEESAARAHEAIRSGSVAAHPANPDKCLWCDFRDICRVESAPATRKAGGS